MNLTDEQKIAAFDAVVNVAFEGILIVEPDGTIIWANDQFYDLLNVSPADVIGKRYQDITPLGQTRDRDIQNAEMVKNGDILNYAIKKSYSFNDKETPIVLAVGRVPYTYGSDLDLYIAKVLPDETPVQVCGVSVWEKLYALLKTYAGFAILIASVAVALWQILFELLKVM